MGFTPAICWEGSEVYKGRMRKRRAALVGLEALVDDDLWPLPTYQELLFMR